MIWQMIDRLHNECLCFGNKLDSGDVFVILNMLDMGVSFHCGPCYRVQLLCGVCFLLARIQQHLSQSSWYLVLVLVEQFLHAIHHPL